MPLHSLTVEKLSCLRGGRLVFRELSFAIEAGRVIALEGANGAGKTSLLRILAGFLAPVSGTIWIRLDSADMSDAEERGRHVGWLGHLDAAKPQLTAGETLRFFAALYGVAATTEAIARALGAVGLDKLEQLPCQFLSAGQRKRLALARLSVVGRPLWLMDEPLAALDAEGKALAARMIETHCASGGLAVVATHEPLGTAAERLVLGAAP